MFQTQVSIKDTDKAMIEFRIIWLKEFLEQLSSCNG